MSLRLRRSTSPTPPKNSEDTPGTANALKTPSLRWHGGTIYGIDVDKSPGELSVQARSYLLPAGKGSSLILPASRLALSFDGGGEYMLKSFKEFPLAVNPGGICFYDQLMWKYHYRKGQPKKGKRK